VNWNILVAKKKIKKEVVSSGEWKWKRRVFENKKKINVGGIPKWNKAKIL